MDETHFIYDLDNRTVLGRHDQTVTYNDIVMGSQEITVVLCLTGGRNARLLDPFSFYRMRVVTIPYVKYRTMYRVVVTVHKEAGGWTVVCF